MDFGLSLSADHPGYTLAESVDLARAAEAAGFRSVWRGETSGLNAFLVLGHLATHTSDVRLGTGIVNVYARTPSLLAMTAATLEELSGGRTVLGLGVSTEPLIERWHGLSFEDPLRRTRETIEILDQVFRSGSVDYDGEVFDVGPYNAAFESRAAPPIYVGAMGEANLRLTGAFADGWLPSMLPFSRLEAAMSTVEAAATRANRSPDDVRKAVFVPVTVASDPERAEHQIRRFLAREMAMGYDELATTVGFAASVTSATERWLAGDRDAAAGALSQDLVDELAVYGTPETVTERLRQFEALGFDEVVVLPPFAADVEDVRRTIDALER